MKVCGPQESHHRLGWAAGEYNIILYADDSDIAGCNPIWVQTTLAAVVRMFDRLVLLKNIGKTKKMVCTPSFIWVQQGTKNHNRRATG